MKQKQKRIFAGVCNGVIVTAGIFILAGGFLNYMVLDVSLGYEALGRMMESELGLREGKLAFSGFTLLKSVFTANDYLDLSGNPSTAALYYELVLIAVPYAMAGIVILFGALKNWWSYIVSSILGMLNVIILLINFRLLLPRKLAEMVEGVCPGWAEAILDLVLHAANEPDLISFLRKRITEGLGVGFWTALGGSVVICLGSVLALCFQIGKKKRHRVTYVPSTGKKKRF